MGVCVGVCVHACVCVLVHVYACVNVSLYAYNVLMISLSLMYVHTQSSITHEGIKFVWEDYSFVC